MTKALDLISRAYDLLGYKDPNESLSGTDSQAGLDALNSMLDSWNTQRLFIVSVAEVTQSVSGLPITIGPSGVIAVARPVRLEDGSFIRNNGADFQIKWVGRSEYDSIVVKNTPGTLSYYGYYEPSLPDGALFLWPYPSTPVELHLQLQVQLTQFADLVTDYSLAPGYRRAIEYSLAEELAPGKRALDPKIMQTAANARRVIRRSNVEALPQTLLPAAPSPYAAFIAGL